MSSSNRRQREIAAARAQRRQARVAAAAQRDRNRLRAGRIAAAAGIVIALVLVWNPSLQPWHKDVNVVAPTPLTGTPTTQPTRQPLPSLSGVPTGQPSTQPSSTSVAGAAYHPSTGQYASMTLNTNQGAIAIALDNRAPRTLASMAKLSAKGYFNTTHCHRLTTAGIYVLQCGDPKGDGTGGPGYSIADENLPSTANGLLTGASSALYPRGVVAMANSGPNTNGSQFFLVYKDSPLPPNYTVWGEVTSGLDVIDRVAAAGAAGGSTDGPPNTRVVINSTVVR